MRWIHPVVGLVVGGCPVLVEEQAVSLAQV